MTSTDSQFLREDARPVSAPEYQRIKMLFELVCNAAEQRIDGKIAPDDMRALLLENGASESEILQVSPLIARTVHLGDGCDSADRKASASSRNPMAGEFDFGRPAAWMFRHILTDVLQPGQRLGPWKIISLIGAGGMGNVYRAERADGAFTQTAAIKLLSGLPTADALSRLDRERRILASLAHPNIARLIDGGMTDSGHPYLAIDFVDGINIDTYCSQSQLDRRAVVKLMLQVCAAVEYAHQRLTLHCDIKPSNVMIDRVGRPILLDFGIAQLIAQPSVDVESVVSGMLTVDYASPEQLAGAQLGTATDIYSLGRMLHTLVGKFNSANGFGRELEYIIKCATSVNIENRYASVASLAADLQSLLDDMPVAAHGRQPLYVARKFLQRQWVAVATIIAFFGMGIALTTGALIQRDRAVHAESAARAELERALAAEGQAAAERDRAQVAELRAKVEAEQAERSRVDASSARDRSRLEAERAMRAEAKAIIDSDSMREVRDFMVGLFDDMNASPLGARKLTAYELLSKGRAKLDKGLIAQPQVRSTLLLTVGKIYDNAGDLDNAKQLYREAISLERDPQHGRPLVLAQLLSKLALAESNSGNASVGEPLAKESLAIRKSQFSTDSLELADSHGTLGLVYSGMRQTDLAREHLEESLRIRLKLVGERDEATASALHNLGMLHAMSGRHAEGVKQYERAIAIKTTLFGDKHPKTFSSMEGLGLTLWRANRLQEAEPVLAKLYQGQLDINGNQSERFASAADAWANVLYDMGRYVDARMRFQEALTVVASHAVANRSFRYAVYSHNLALLHEEMGDVVSAESLYQQSIAVRSRLLDKENVLLARANHAYGRILLRAGKYPEASRYLQLALDLREKKLQPSDMELFDSRLSMVELALQNPDRQSAVSRAATAYALLDVPTTLSVSRRINYHRLGAKIKLAMGDARAAAQIANEYVKLCGKLYSESHPRLTLATLEYADYLWASGDKQQAAAIANALKNRLADAVVPTANQYATLKRILGESITP
jgi:eukaryotic-like serine/threonine-protein kinase